MALSPERIKELRKTAGVSAEVPKANLVSPDVVQQRLAKFNQATGSTVAPKEEKKPSALKGFATGLGKEALSLVKGAGQFGEKVGKAILPKALESESVYSEEALQTDKEKGGAMGKLFNEENLEAKTNAEKAGKFVGQVAEFAIPSTKIGKLNQGKKALDVVKRVAGRATSSGTVATVEEGGIGTDSAIAAGTEIALPIAGKIFLAPLKRLVKGLASGISGLGEKGIDAMFDNPQASKEAVKTLETGGNRELITQNTKKIVHGIADIKKEARTAYGDALQELTEQDIKPATFRSKLQPILDKYGSVVEGNTRTLENIEFDNPVNLKKASAIIDRAQNTDLDGKSLKKTIDWIDDQRYRTATTDERLAYNAFVGDIVDGLKKSINESTDKLGEMNAKYTADMQIAEAMEDVFGKVKFKNLSELQKASEKLETLFAKKGLSPDHIDDFLTRVGIDPSEFKASEAVRQISTKSTGNNVKGLSGAELFQQATSAAVTPKFIRNAAIFMGMAEPQVKKIMEALSPTARGALIRSLIGD